MTRDKAAHLLVIPGFADWEPAHAIAELRRSGGYRVEVVGLSGDVVESMGGLPVRPTRTPGYADEASYVDAPAVRDRGLITASGVADVEFAAQIMAELSVLTDEERTMWSEMFRSGRIAGTEPREG